MLKTFNISEQEKRQILNHHKLLKENDEIKFGVIENDPKYNFYDKIWKYEGFLKNGIIDTTDVPVKDLGKSKITFSDGNYFVGEFKDGQIEGEGVFHFKSGLKLSGEFALNEENESGITYQVTLNDGRIINDIFKYELNNRIKTIGLPGWVTSLIDGNDPNSELTVQNCNTQLKQYSDLIRKINNKEIDLTFVNKINNYVKPVKTIIKNCYRQYPDEMKKQKNDFLLVRNPGGDSRQFTLVLENTNKRDIYNKSSMGLNNTISKVILEHKENKERRVQENNIIKNRLNFVLTENKDSLIDLINEKNILLKNGYDGQLVEKNYNLIVGRKFRNIGGEK